MIFWNNHNPTTINQQGPDIGEQYRSAIFFHNPEQEAIANKLKDKLQETSIKKFNKKIVTQIVPAKKFFKAEEYHQKYLEKNNLAHCSSKVD
jgi:peptide-methionine (S)-S-oxide reductase